MRFNEIESVEFLRDGLPPHIKSPVIFANIGDTVLYNGFGGYRVEKNGETFYEGDINGHWDSFLTLEEIEKRCKKDTNTVSIYEVILYTPLRGATWRRNKKGFWVLKETNQGFA